MNQWPIRCKICYFSKDIESIVAELNERKKRIDNFWVNSGKTDHSGRVQAQTSLRPRITSQDLCALCLRRSQTLLLQRARKRAYIFKLHTYYVAISYV